MKVKHLIHDPLHPRNNPLNHLLRYHLQIRHILQRLQTPYHIRRHRLNHLRHEGEDLQRVDDPPDLLHGEFEEGGEDEVDQERGGHRGLYRLEHDLGVLFQLRGLVDLRGDLRGELEACLDFIEGGGGGGGGGGGEALEEAIVEEGEVEGVEEGVVEGDI